ncbi:MAG: ABC transporter ATP-binding protein [Archaeoglobaceae archaeon]|nr:ABC transporter ATP-binding protein [Archaeoglobaceae archaeon]MCX8151919.1 ABC transporter ATP-binding protein [Archaeoglobaceae archaeon]MDW8013308.1 ABC transporter ATP-binding protein [Archaeoglobaceae archaeon]
MREVIVELKKVWKVFKTKYYEIHALRGIDLQIEKGEFLIVMGPSGSGKSTLLHLIGCLDKPTSGEVLIDGISTSKLSDSELTNLRRDKIGFIFQQYNLIPTLTVFENVELPMVLKGVSRDERKKRVSILLEMLGIKDTAQRRPNELSGGQQQRVAIARALANDPKILLCDEPTGNLDSRTGEQIIQKIKELNKKENVTVVLVTHNPSFKVFGDRVIYLRDGQIVDVT